MKKTWEIINELRGKKKSRIKPQFIIDNEKITNRRIIANEFNKYFVSIAKNLNESLLPELEIRPIPKFTNFLGQSNQSSIFLEDCSLEEITKIIDCLQNNKASDIPINIIKRSAPIIIPILVSTFNHCMNRVFFLTLSKLEKSHQFLRKGMPRQLKTIDLSPLSQSLAKFSKKLFMSGYTVFSPHKIY